MVSTLSTFQPHRTMYLRGFDRRGCAASMNNASDAGFTVSGVWADLADFVVLVLQDVDDLYGHLPETRYLPNFDLTGVVLDFDLAITNGMYPGSTKFQSVPWGMLSYITASGTSGTVALDITSTTGEVAASQTYTVNGTPVEYDRVQLIYLGNVVFDYIVNTGDTTATVAAELVAQINAATSATVPLTAVQSGSSFTVTCTQPGNDGNTIELLEMHKTATCYLTPAGASKLTGGVDPTRFHVHLDFSALGLTSLVQCWLTLAPPLPIDTTDADQTLKAFVGGEFSYVFLNWTVTDPNNVTPLNVAGAGSVIVGSQDSWTRFSGSGWAPTEGFYYHGFANASSHAGDSVSIFYSCQSTHDLYLGTMLGPGLGTFNVELDGIAQPALDTALSVSVTSRRLLASSVPAGQHTVKLTLASGTCWFDYIQAAVVSGTVAAPSTTYAGVNASFDYDTGQTYQIPPARALWLSQQLGFQGDLDFYAGVFFALKRVRYGGSFHQATVTLSGTFSAGTGFGNGDAIFVDIGGTTFGAADYPADTLETLAQRLVNGVNGLFVGVWAAPTSTAGQFTITCISPINGFTLSVYTSAGATGTVSTSGDINAGNEGTWNVDPTQTSPLNRAFVDYLTDLTGLMQAAGQTMTLAFSQELLGAPDQNTAAGAWVQRFADGTIVLTDTGFGSWGSGYVDGVSGSTITQTGHGYYSGYVVSIASGTGSGQWAIAVTDANHYELTTELANSGGYSPSVGDSVLAEVQTAQCAFNPGTVTPYLQNCYVQAAGIMASARLTPWLQFGEILHWFFSETMSLTIAGFSDRGGLIEVETSAPHGFATGQTAILAGTGIVDGTQKITVVDSTHFTVNGSTWPGGTSGAAGTASGGGMAFYDANQTAAANTALGRALASFYTQDDDPSINSYADANFLRGRIYTHISTIISGVLAAQASAKFELLYPLDVNFPSCYYTAPLPFPQGGRLNTYVNLPSQFMAESGSGLNRFKMEGLSWQATYFNQANHLTTMRYPYQVLSWTEANTALLVGWFNGSCPWTLAYLAAKNEGIPLVNLWAADHTQLMSWPQALPVNPVEVH
jgi:hypothetical protein